jgi:hypothetical protein
MKEVIGQDQVTSLEDAMNKSEEEEMGRKKGEEIQEFVVSGLPRLETELNGQKVRLVKGMSKAEEVKLLQFVLDCGGVIKTVSSTHDINLKSNIFLHNFFTLSRGYKKECHDISNVLVSLSSKIKSIH